MAQLDNITKKQVRFHGRLDGSSLAHAIQVPMGPCCLAALRKTCVNSAACHSGLHTQGALRMYGEL